MPDEAVVEQQAESTAKAVETEQAAASAVAEKVETQLEPSAEEGQKPPEKGGVQRRIDELTKARRLAEAEAEFWRQKALSGAPGDKPAAVEKPKAKPNPADFETTEAYLDARDAWVREETMRSVQVELEKRDKAYEERSEGEILAAEWGERETAVQEAHADYEDVTSQAFEVLQSSKGPATAAIAHAVQYSESGPEILYYLGQHPEEVKKLSQLHPTQAVIALGRIEGRLANENPAEAEKPTPQTKAPKPPAPIRKPSAAATNPDPNNPEDAERMSIEDWRKAREAKLKGR